MSLLTIDQVRQILSARCPTANLRTFEVLRSRSSFAGGTLERITAFADVDGTEVAVRFICKSHRLIRRGHPPPERILVPRETYFYASRIREVVQRVARVPELIGICFASCTLLLCVEQIEGELGAPRDVGELTRLAKLAGLMACAVGPSYFEWPWTVGPPYRRWIDGATLAVDTLASYLTNCGQETRARQAALSKLARVAAEGGRYVAILESLPVVFSHNNLSQNSVVYQPSSGSPPAIAGVSDWSSASYAPVGAELATLIGSTVFAGGLDIDQMGHAEAAVLRAYSREVDSVLGVSAAEVATGYYAASAVRLLKRCKSLCGLLARRRSHRATVERLTRFEQMLPLEIEKVCRCRGA